MPIGNPSVASAGLERWGRNKEGTHTGRIAAMRKDVRERN